MHKPCEIQTGVTAQASCLLTCIGKGSEVKHIAPFPLTNLEVGCHRDLVNSKLRSVWPEKVLQEHCPSQQGARPPPQLCNAKRPHTTFVPRAIGAVGDAARRLQGRRAQSSPCTPSSAGHQSGVTKLRSLAVEAVVCCPTGFPYGGRG